jgi:RNA polymerase-interacting CarD/CdnL/TRCF family regulator
METNRVSATNENVVPLFSPGTTVIYGLHGRCKVSSIESRAIDGQEARFYKLEVLKLGIIKNPTHSRKPEPAIWVPVITAQSLGLRLPISQSESEHIFSILGNKEYYFPLNEDFSAIQPKVEAMIRNEGGTGLAKAVSYLYTLKKKQIVPSSEVTKMYDSISKLLYRELSEALGGETIRSLDERITKMMRPKLTPDH